jgi:hypothetical protein
MRTILLIAWACLTLTCATLSRQPHSSNNSPTPADVPTNSRPIGSSIQSIDFGNFTYPAAPDFSAEQWSLKNGKYEGDSFRDPVVLASIAYGDVTGDGSDEAFIILEISVRGTAIPHVVYIYAEQRGNPKLLWSFSTGDRGDGGLRRVYSERGELIVELYGKDRLIGKPLYTSDPYATEGICCPKFFTRARYKWQGDHFQQDEKEEVLPNPEAHGSIMMTPYRPR